MPRRYVDNAYNRSVGRVGMPVGSAVISRSGGGGGSSSGSRSSGGGSMSFGGFSFGGSSSYGGEKTYVDNAQNRALGRVGMPHGSMVVSKGSDSSSYSSGSGEKTYVDNAQNRALGRVGMPHGSMVVSKGSDSSSYSSGSREKTYVDNAYNRSLGRVGMPHGSMVVSRSDDAGARPKSATSSASSELARVYKDNPLNRRLGRVGKPLGTMMYSKAGQKGSPVKNEVYVDNALNRRLGRVGMPRGCMPVSKKCRETEMMAKMFMELRKDGEGLEDFDWGTYFPDIPEETQMEVCENVLNMYNRQQQVREWKEECHTGDEPQTSKKVLKEYSGTKIDFDELELGKKIGQGGFGDVYFAKWSGTVVAVKKLRVQRVSKRRLQEFTDEIMLLCKLDHPRIVKFIGACVKTPNLCIVMEYMQMSLFDALHIYDKIDFSEKERVEIIRQTAAGMMYLHSSNVAHCDMKSRNVLLDFEPGEVLMAKITDFGLSMMREETEVSSSGSDGGNYVMNIGTPRYSAPEVLRGEMLGLRAMKMADMYSYSLVVYEVICEEEPFYKMNYRQLQAQVGEKGLLPKIPDDVNVEFSFHRVLMDCWSRNPEERPSAEEFHNFSLDNNRIYAE